MELVNNMKERSKRIEFILKEVQSIREAIDSLAVLEDKAILSSHGVAVSESETESDSDELSCDGETVLLTPPS